MYISIPHQISFIMLLLSSFNIISISFAENTQNETSTLNLSPQIISFIRSKQYSEAIQLFKKFSDSDAIAKLPDIVTSVYARHISNVENVLAFTKYLPMCSHDKLAYETLLDAMKGSGHHTQPEIVMLVGSVESCDNSIKEIRTKVWGYVTDVILDWAEDIRNGEYDHIEAFYKKYGGKINYHALNLILPEIIKVTYAGNFSNVESLLAFLRALPSVTNDAVGYPTLYEEMKRSGLTENYQSILRFAFRVKESFGFITNNTASNVRENLTQLMHQLPSVIQKIVWGDVCTIKNVYYGEYLYPAVAGFCNPDGERQVFTWIPNDNSFSEAKWKFVTEDQGLHFQIINDHWQKTGKDNVYLAMDKEEIIDGYRMNIWATSKGNANKKRQLNWSVEPIMINSSNPAKGTFYLREADDDFYLYAGNDTSIYDQDKRRVFTLVGTRAIPSASGWEIDCAWH